MWPYICKAFGPKSLIPSKHQYENKTFKAMTALKNARSQEKLSLLKVWKDILNDTKTLPVGCVDWFSNWLLSKHTITVLLLLPFSSSIKSLAPLIVPLRVLFMKDIPVHIHEHNERICHGILRICKEKMMHGCSRINQALYFVAKDLVSHISFKWEPHSTLFDVTGRLLSILALLFDTNLRCRK